MTDTQLARIISGSAQRRYHLVNRALKANELLRIQRGIYVLPTRYRDYPPHPYAVAQALEPGSYVSLETALAFHGWIPEAVYTVSSIVPGRKSRELDHDMLGRFTFHPLATEQGYFLELVSRHRVDQQTALIAKPVRALMDLVCLRKTSWQGIGWLVDGLRIDYEILRSVTSADIRTLEYVYKQKRVKQFLKALAKELGND